MIAASIGTNRITVIAANTMIAVGLPKLLPITPNTIITAYRPITSSIGQNSNTQ
ncbi:hypothetical protein D3C75_960300 [compost metagenome]